MAQFGMPGGWEVVAILVTILLLFVPGILLFGAGFLFGKKSAEKSAQTGIRPEQEGSGPAETAAPGPTEHGDTDGDADV